MNAETKIAIGRPVFRIDNPTADLDDFRSLAEQLPIFGPAENFFDDARRPIPIEVIDPDTTDEFFAKLAAPQLTFLSESVAIVI